MTATAMKYVKYSHMIQGPISPFFNSFIASLEESQFNGHTIIRQLRITTKFSRWLEQHGVLASDISNKHKCDFFDDQQYQCSVSRGYVSAINRLLEHLDGLGVITLDLPQVVEKSPIDTAVDNYAQHLRTTVCLAERSVAKYCPIVRLFLLDQFKGGDPACSELRAADVTSYFTKIAPAISVSLAKSTATAIRSYLRYLVCSGQNNRDLVGSVPTMPNWTLCDIPRSISAEHAKKVIDHCSRDTTVGLRDYAILLLLARLGLRSSEVVSLTLDSIDWDCSSLSFIGKGKEPAVLPITREVGEALANYIKNGRPTCSSRALFLRNNAPIRGLGAPTSIATIVRSAILRAGITTSSYGSHQFRHALATSMINNGATLTEVSSVLRHRRSKTTMIYAKVDFDSMRALCLPIPGEGE